MPFTLVVLLVVLAGTATGFSIHQAPTAGAAYLVQCPPIPTNLGPAEERPSSLLLACADGGIGLTDLRWRGWGLAQASATGVLFWNTCSPNCAHGQFVSRPDSVEVGQLEDGKFYTGLRLNWAPAKRLSYYSFPPAP